MFRIMILYPFLPVLYAVGRVVVVESLVHGRLCSYRRMASFQLSMVVVSPVGPFCPFRSAASSMTGIPRVDEREFLVTDITEEFKQIQKGMMMGQTLDADRLRKVANFMDVLVDQWEGLQNSPDFQAREMAKLSEAQFKASGFSSQACASMMKWQSGCLRSLADNTPPPIPPNDLDLNGLINEVRKYEGSDKGRKVPSFTAIQAATRITATPFDPEEYESDLIKQEYTTLVMDHSNLIELGSKYVDMDPLGKISFLDQMEAIEERWDAFIFHFKLMNSFNKEYIEQCEQFLTSMKLTKEEYRELLKESHRLMRLEAERERERSNSFIVYK